jgi:5-methylthioadenosine/S-adenosylhomocysteine deaminase
LNPGFPADILIRNISLLAGPNPSQFLPKGWLSVKDRRITAIGTGDPPPIFASRDIDGHGCLLMPGLVNSHAHAAMALFRGLADDLPLQTWLERHIFPAEKKWVNAEFVYWGSLLAIAEMIRSGTTTFADGYFFEEQVARAAEQSGMRGILGQGILDFPAPDSPSPAETLRRIEAFLQIHASSSLIHPALFIRVIPVLLIFCGAVGIWPTGMAFP